MAEKTLQNGILWQGWKWPAAAVGAALAGIGLIFRQDVVGAWQVWVSSATYNHCFLIIPMVAYMIWGRRHRIAAMVPRPEWRGLALIPLVSMVWLAASFLGVLELRQFAVLTIMQAAILGIIGWPAYKRLLAPLLYLYFLVPSGAILIPLLQGFTARFAVFGLHLAGIPVFSDGTVIDIPAGTFVVAEACAGLRFLVAAFAFGVFYAMEIFDGYGRRLMFIALSLVVPIIANGVRVFGLIAAAEIVGSGAAIEADHVTFGWVFFSLVLVVLIWAGRLFSDRGRKPSAEAVPTMSGAVGSRQPILLAGAACIALAGIVPLAASALEGSAGLTMPATPPGVGASWHAVANGMPDWHPVVVRADRSFVGRFSDGNVTVDRFVALYEPSGRTSNLIRSDNRVADPEIWHPVSTGRAMAQIDGRTIAVDTATVVSDRRQRVIWSFYVVNGKPMTGLLAVKLHQGAATFSGKRCLSAFVAVSTEGVSDAALKPFLAAMTGLTSYLCPPT